MKQLKSSTQSLRDLFENSITIAHLVEPLKAVTADAEVATILPWMELHDFDVMGIKIAGRVTGYVERSALRKAIGNNPHSKCIDYQKNFSPDELVAISTPLLKLMLILRQHLRVFVLDCNQVNGIVTCGDLQKAPVRMLLFGLITLLEMNLLRLVQRYYPNHRWQEILKSDRLEAAQKLWRESQARNEATELIDYLQFCDKRDLIIHNLELMQLLGLNSKRGAEKFFKATEQLRNRLAHAQDLTSGSSWLEVIDLAGAIENVLIASESIE